MKHTKSIMNPNKKRTNLSWADFFMLLGMISFLLLFVIVVAILQTGIEIPLSIPYSIANLVCIFGAIGVVIKLYTFIRHRGSNFKCLYTSKFDEHLFRCGIFKKESDETVIIPLVGDNPNEDNSKFFIYASYDFSDQLLNAKDYINSFLAKEHCNYRVVDCYLDDDRVIYICQRKIYLDRIDCR